MNIAKRIFGYGDLILQSYKIRKTDSPEEREAAYKKLSKRMGEMHGVPQKIGQLMGMTSKESSTYFSDLGSDSKALEFDIIKDILEKHYKKPLEGIFSYFEQSAHAASLGQVHRAILKNGRQVAVKVQYPDIRKTLESEISAMTWLSQLKAQSQIKFDTASYKKEFKRDIDEELDYEHEASLQIKFKENLSGFPQIIVPEIVSELSSKEILVSHWEEGLSLKDVCEQWNEEDKTEVAKSLMQLFTHSLFGCGLLHADPHQGNYLFRKNNSNIEIVLLDYGSVFQCDQQFRLTLMKLIQATTEAAKEDPYRLMLGLGFDADLLEPLIPKLPALSSVLFEPYENPMIFDLKSWNRVERIHDILGDDRWNFRMSGPARFVFLIRAFHGIISQLSALNKNVSWLIPLKPYFEKEKNNLNHLLLPETHTSSVLFDGMAKHLVILVEKNGLKKAQVKLPAKRIDNIESLIEDNIKEKINEHGIKLKKIIKTVRENGYLPQDIFCLEENDSVVSIKLE